MSDQNSMAELSQDLLVTEERTQTLALDRSRISVSHSLTIHRDKTAVTDIEAMIAYLLMNWRGTR